MRTSSCDRFANIMLTLCLLVICLARVQAHEVDKDILDK